MSADNVWYDGEVVAYRTTALSGNPAWSTARAILVVARILAIFVNRWTRLQKHEKGYDLGD